MTNIIAPELYFFEIEDNIEKHVIIAYTKEQAGEIYIRTFMPEGDISLNFVSLSSLKGTAEGSMIPERIYKYGLHRLDVKTPQYITLNILKTLKHVN